MSALINALSARAECLLVLLLVGCGGEPALSVSELLARADAARGRGELPAAVVDLKQVLQGQPDLHDARLSLALACLDLFDGACAEAHFEKLRIAGFAHPQLESGYFRALLLQDRFGQILREALGNPDPGVLTVLGEANLAMPAQQSGADAEVLRRAYRETATKEFRKALERDPEHYAAHLGLAHAALVEARFVAATDRIDKAAALAPQRPEAFILRGILGQLTLDLDGAERAFAGALERAPHSLLAAVGLARVLLGQAQREEALSLTRALQRDHPRHPVVDMLVAEAHLLSDEPQSAIALLQKSGMARSGAVARAELLIRAFIRSGQREQALAAVSDLLALDPDSRFAARARAQIDLQHGDAEAALAALRRMPPDDFLALELLGRAYRGEGNNARADWYLARARELAAANAAHPKSVPVSLWANFIPPTVSDATIETVITAAERRLDERPDDPAAHFATGRARLNDGDEPGARDAFHAALRGDSRHIPSLLALARLEAAAGQHDVATLMYQRVLAVERSNVEALVGLTKLDAPDVTGSAEQ